MREVESCRPYGTLSVFPLYTARLKACPFKTIQGVRPDRANSASALMGAMCGTLFVSDAGRLDGGGAALVVVGMDLHTHFVLGCRGIACVVGIEHGDHRDGAGAVTPGPVAL